jgi:T-complex protein 1 subunit alpha
VVVTDPKKLEEIRQRESDITKERIELLLKAGANVILTTKGIDDMALKYFVEANCIALRRVKKEDLRRIAKLTGGTLMITLADMEGNESFDPSLLGVADEVSEERICDDDHLVIKGGKSQRYCSVLLRGANSHMLDEVDRSLHDALCAVKRALESSSVVPGGGCVESALSIYLENFATTLGSREQLAIAEFAEALLVIPKQVRVEHWHGVTHSNSSSWTRFPPFLPTRPVYACRRLRYRHRHPHRCKCHCPFPFLRPPLPSPRR